MQARRHVDDRLQTELHEETGGGQDDEEIVFLQQPREAPENDEGEEGDDDEADDEAELLAGDGEDKIGMGVGQVFLDRSFARSASPKSAVAEGFHRAVDLVAVAARGIEEAVDAV